MQDCLRKALGTSIKLASGIMVASNPSLCDSKGNFRLTSRALRVFKFFAHSYTSLLRDGIETTVITDGMSGALMRSGRVDVVVVGAEPSAQSAANTLVVPS